jgi:hypothetical protein
MYSRCSQRSPAKATLNHWPGCRITEYGNWRQESGLLQPYKFVERVVRAGRILNTLEWDRITSNDVIAKAELIRPATP